MNTNEVITWLHMEYFRDADGLYHVVRYRSNGELSITPYGFKTKDSAISYIKAHGLYAKERGV